MSAQTICNGRFPIALMKGRNAKYSVSLRISGYNSIFKIAFFPEYARFLLFNIFSQLSGGLLFMRKKDNR